ncbi:hypothetical protein [Cupriavidus sp. PET2-C1]
MKPMRGIALTLRFLDGDATVTEADCLAAKDDADRAEAAARAAFRLTLQPLVNQI